MTEAIQSDGVAGRLAIAAVRRLAEGLRSDVGDAQLAGLFNKVLETVPLLQRSWAELGFQVGKQQHCIPGAITLPLRGDGSLRGVLRHPIDAGPLGKRELEFLHATADLLGAVAELAARSREVRSARAMVQCIADQMPVGVVCVESSGAVLACNRAAAAFLEGCPGLERESWRSVLGLAGPAVPASHCVRRGDQMALVHVRPLGGEKATTWEGGVALVLDLSASVGAFREAVARETYRCLFEQRELTLAAVDAPAGVESLLLGADALRQRLPPPLQCGPLGLDSFGFLLPELNRVEAMAILRGLPEVGDVAGVRVGVASLCATVSSPQALLQTALHARQAWSAAMRPELLVFDASPAVTEAVSLIFRAHCRVATSNRRSHMLDLVAMQPFDGLLIELPSVPDDANLAFVREVVGRQPVACPFYLSEISGPWGLQDMGLPVAPVFRKPFSVREMRSAVMHALAAG